MKKKLIAALLACGLMGTMLVGCGSSEQTNDTQVTTVYTSIDFDSLRDCALEVPPLTSKFYSGGDSHAS